MTIRSFALELATFHRSIKLCRAITSSILVRWQRLINENAYNAVFERNLDRYVMGWRRRYETSIVVPWWRISYAYTQSTLTSSKHHIIQILFNFMIAIKVIQLRAKYRVKNRIGRFPYLLPTEVVPPRAAMVESWKRKKRSWEKSGRQ